MKKKPCWSALPRQPKFWTTRDECGPCCSRRSQQSSGAGTFSVPLVSPLTRSLPTRPDTERSQTQQWRSKGSQIREFTTPFKQTQKKKRKKKEQGSKPRWVLNWMQRCDPWPLPCSGYLPHQRRPSFSWVSGHFWKNIQSRWEKGKEAERRRENLTARSALAV